MYQCFLGCYKWATCAGFKKTSLADDQAIKIFKDLKQELQWIRSSTSMMVLRQTRTNPSSADAYWLLDQFAKGDMWTSSTGVLEEIARQLRQTEGQVHVGHYGAMKAQCDLRRGQFQVWDRTRA